MTDDAIPEFVLAPRADRCQEPHPDGPAASGDDNAYASPVLIDLGHVREVTLGSSPSGNADANAQYYW